ncbi:MAG: fructosamine kinase family protein [Lentisphaeraceae bacterium]|nr:fructosamine kinase family protein [Lentisphaeraceae bacterium]
MNKLRAEDLLTQITGKSYAILDVSPVSGGDISKVWKIETTEEKLFLKKNSLDNKPLTKAEWRGLKELSLCKDIKTPRCFGVHEEQDSCFLLLEHLDFYDHNSESMAQLGTKLAKMHKITAANFGFFENNYIGASPQINNWSESWVKFFINCRIMPQAYMTGEPFVEIKAEHLAKKIPHFFENYLPIPSLLHGDLWSGNTGRLSNNEPVIYDPAVYYGDRETDIAMTEMFGGFTTEFYDAYNKEFPLDPGYKKRKNLYILYHTLNHLNLFGDSYLPQTKDLINIILCG